MFDVYSPFQVERRLQFWAEVQLPMSSLTGNKYVKKINSEGVEIL